MIYTNIIKSTSVVRRFFFTRKLLYGQGGKCYLNLTQQNYNIQLQSIWEDHSLITIQDQQHHYLIRQSSNITNITDHHPTSNHINIKLSIPQDYTLAGIINGNLKQLINPLTTNKLRSLSLQLTMLGNNQIQLHHVEAQTVSIQAHTLNIKQLTLQSGTIQCHHYQSNKLMLSKQLQLTADQTININSLINFASASSNIHTKQLICGSIEGSTNINCATAKINRVYSNHNNIININCQELIKCQIQTGQSTITTKKQTNNITIGKHHKGKIISNFKDDMYVYSVKL